MRIILFSLLVFVCGCSLLGQKSENSLTTNPVEIRDVPQAARTVDENSLRRRLVLLPFIEGENEVGGFFGERAREAILQAVSQVESVVLVDPQDLGLNLQDYLDKGEYKVADLAKKIGPQGISGIIESKILNVRAKRKADEVGMFRNISSEIEATVRVRVVATRNGKEIFSRIKTAKTEDSTRRVLERTTTDGSYRENPEVIQSLVDSTFLEVMPEAIGATDKLSWEGRIALVQGERIYLNVGRLSGIQVGDLLKVSEEGNEIFDPESGGAIGKVPGRIKGTLEVVSYFGQDGSIGVIHSGAGFKENDRVELY